MWSVTVTEIGRDVVQRFGVMRDNVAVSCSEVVEAWSGDTAFRGWFNELLAGVPYDAFRWETPAVTSATARRPFEFVVLNSPSLAVAPDPGAFAGQFDRAPGTDVVSFTNLGGDALMIVPRPIVALSAYGHLAAFVRQAPASQQQSFWQTVGEAMTRRISTKPVWLSTAGGGVAWLHVRLDDRPKYYGFSPFAKAP